MDFSSFVEGPLLRVVLTVFALALIARLCFFVIAIITDGKGSDHSGINPFISILRSFIPFHRAALKKPAYSFLRYVFHTCLFIVPIWLAGHVSLWEESRFELEWAGLPGDVADVMTIVVVILALLFLIRRAIIKDARMNSSLTDFVVIIIAAFPFVSGYLLTHGTLDNVAFVADNIWTIHILSGELMIFMTVFLFCRAKMNPSKCTGCASCELACPTGTLESQDLGNTRVFNYSHYQCICCASCVDTCPEDAAELRHELSVRKISRILTKKEIRSVEMDACKRCGKLFVPEPLHEKIEKSFHHDALNFCPDCRKVNIGDYMQKLSPWHHKMKKKAQGR